MVGGDDEMVEELDLGDFAELDEAAGKIEVGFAGLEVAGRVVVRDHDGVCAPLERAVFYVLAWCRWQRCHHFGTSVLLTIHLLPLVAPSRTRRPASFKARTARHMLFSEMFSILAICAAS